MQVSNYHDKFDVQIVRIIVIWYCEV